VVVTLNTARYASGVQGLGNSAHAGVGGFNFNSKIAVHFASFLKTLCLGHG
jgi:hypothetical protein